ncbi:MAG: hypothetical protein JW958_10365 [Candidatus Eisenbacteria bacterium]|nr:hypothetical protein [Candidatus Eisenbacteria bacterium]
MADAYRVLLVQGPYPLVRGFISGFLTGKGIGGRVHYCEKEKLHVDVGDEGFTDRLKEWIGLKDFLATPVVIDESLHGPLVEAFHSSRHDLSLSVKVDVPVTGASFRVDFRVYSPEMGAQVKAMVENPPAGLSLDDDFRLEEKKHEDAAGVEAYAPEHAYELHGEGTIHGELEALIAFRDRIRENPLVHCEPIRIEIRKGN